MFEVRQILAAIVMGGALSLLMTSQALAAAEIAPQVPKLSAEQVVEKHVAARGGAQAWKAVQSMQLSGKIDAGRGDNLARAQKLVNAGKKASGKGSKAEIAAITPSRR